MFSFVHSYRSSEGLIIIASGNTSTFITMLPKGNQSNNYEVKLEAQIFDSLGDASTVHLAVQVIAVRHAFTYFFIIIIIIILRFTFLTNAFNRNRWLEQHAPF